MIKKFITFVKKHGYEIVMISLVTFIVGAISLATIARIFDINYRRSFDAVNKARFVKYTKDYVEAVDYGLIIDKDTGVQYLVTDDGVTVLMNPDGTPVVTTE